LQEQGHLVGRGLVERELALVINPRMKNQGMRWKRANTTAVVALRVQQFNAYWDAAVAYLLSLGGTRHPKNLDKIRRCC
jgi:hypothetical protein